MTARDRSLAMGTDRTLLTLPIAAEQLGIASDTLRAQIRRKRLRAERLGRDWVVEEREVARYRRDSLGKPGRPRRGSSGGATEDIVGA